MSGAAPISIERDRVDRARRWLQGELAGRELPPLLVLIGLGDGAVLEAIDEMAPGMRVLALEPDALRAQAFLTARAWRAWRESGRLVYLADPDYAGADQAWRIFPPGLTRPPVLLHPDADFTDGTARAAQHLKRIIFGVSANAEARRRFAPRYLVNSIRNLPAIVAGSDVRHLTDAYRGVPAIVAGAGPSLDHAIRDLKAMPSRGLLVAADTALRPLAAAGLVPHLVVALDPSTVNARHLLSLPECRDTWLVSEAALDRQATSVFDRRTFWFRASDHHPGPWLRELGIDIGHLEVWGSVLTGAFQVACLAGCDPIVLVGADLSFTDGRPYARGTTYEVDWACAAARGVALEETWRATVSAGVPAPDVRGGTTRTTDALTSFRDWILAQGARSGRRVVNATGAGILLGAGIEQASLRDVLSQQVSIAPVSTFARRWSSVRPTAMAARVRDVRAMLSSGSGSTAPLLAQWRQFSGDGFDAAVVGAALDEAVRGLETKRGAPARSPLDPWAQPDSAAALVALLPRLPETIARMPAALIGPRPADTATSEAQVTDEERASVLALAWVLLARICEATLRNGDDLSWSFEAGHVGHVRAGALYAWPESTRWAVALFEGLLGDGWPPPSSEGPPAFGSRQLLPGFDTTDRSARPNASCACALLALEWLRSAGAPHEVCSAIAESLRADATAMATSGANAVTHGAPLAIELVRNGATSEVDLRLSFSAPAMALMRTGALREDAVPDLAARQTCDPAAVLAILTSSRQDDLVVRPRVLTRDGGSEYWFISYPTPEGVVCVPQHQRQSVIVDEHGRMRPHRMWPRVVNQERLFGDSGVLAWGNGLSKWQELEPPYVMYRRHPDDDVTIEELPFRPAFGTWWQGRMYWSSFSRREAWRGLVSWAPGEGMREEHVGVTSWAMFPSDDALVIHPCDFMPPHGWRRGAQSTAWTLRPGQPLEPTPLGPYGSASSATTAGAWTATAHPDVDTIRLVARDHRTRSLSCPNPLGVAWAGRSLLVSTLQCELLLFEGLMDVLERL